jgi:hypothetical protein
MLIFRRIFLSYYWWQKSDIWSQALYRYPISWEAIRFLPSIVAEKNATKNGHIQNVCSMCIKINKVVKQEVGIWWVQKRFPRYGVPIQGRYMHIFRHIFLSNYWWQRSGHKLRAPPLKLEKIWFFECDEKLAYMFNVYKNQQNRQTGSRNLMGPKTLPTIWGTYMKIVTV